MTRRRRIAASTFLLGVLLVPLAAAAGGAKAVLVSTCPGRPNAEVVQAVDGRYVYEAWIGCNRSIGFARSADGGRSFGPSKSVRGSAHRPGVHTWDPAIAVAPDGTVYVAYMAGPAAGAVRSSRPAQPVVAVSHDHGRSFDRASRLPVPATHNPVGSWGDRPYIAAGRGGAVYVTWDYGPRRDEAKVVCPPTGSCYFEAGDFNAVIQRSSDGGKTWTKLAPISPSFPLGGVYSAPIVAEPSGALDVLYWQHPTDPTTLRVSPGRQFFTRSTDGGVTWSAPVAVGATTGTIALKTWWIDGSLDVDPNGTIYATWDTQRSGRDTGWLAWSRDGGEHWSSPVEVASGRTEHLTEVAAAGPGSVYVGWQTIVSGKGYATFLRSFSPGRSWTSRATRVSPAYGEPRVWPGDTFGLSAKNASAILSWGSAIKGRSGSEIYSARVAPTSST
ncbi:MAG TPA: sialidase family protein [Gaiellaceae bacterium]|nr:sialidase family protein [Gaiellaceae bacterium]